MRGRPTLFEREGGVRLALETPCCEGGRNNVTNKGGGRRKEVRRNMGPGVGKKKFTCSGDTKENQNTVRRYWSKAVSRRRKRSAREKEMGLAGLPEGGRNKPRAFWEGDDYPRHSCKTVRMGEELPGRLESKERRGRSTEVNAKSREGGKILRVRERK